LKEGGVQLQLTVVDTPGFGDAVNNSDWYVTWQCFELMLTQTRQ